jgi:hypothetical protein
VGTMMASEVPMQSCIRTLSGTSASRNSSNSTGTISAPPPMPNTPASSPVTIPATRIARKSQMSSPVGMFARIAAFICLPLRATAIAVFYDTGRFGIISDPCSSFFQCMQGSHGLPPGDAGLHQGCGGRQSDGSRPRPGIIPLLGQPRVGAARDASRHPSLPAHDTPRS